MFKTLLQIRRDSKDLTNLQWLLKMNNWDWELEQFIKVVGANYRRYKKCYIEWSPEVRSWLRRRWVLARVRKFTDGKIMYPRNIFCYCKKYEIKEPK